jgi:hypothetical protein
MIGVRKKSIKRIKTKNIDINMEHHRLHRIIRFIEELIVNPMDTIDKHPIYQFSQIKKEKNNNSNRTIDYE